MKRTVKLLAAALLGVGALGAQLLALGQEPNAGFPGMASEPETNALRLNFREAPLEMVLDYLSEAAGFVIVYDAQPSGKITVCSHQLLSKEEALELLDSALIKNGYAAIRKGNTLTIVNRDEAKTRGLPVKLGGDPEGIPDNDEIVTQIIPVRFVEVGPLLKDLQGLLPLRATITANESANTIVITDTQANIRRAAEIIKAINSGAQGFIVVKVIQLRHSDPVEMAELLTQLFPDETQSQASGAPVAFGGPGGGFPPGGPGGGFAGFGGPGGFQGGPGGGFSGSGMGSASGGSSGLNQAMKKRTKVVAVPDQRTASVVVTASNDLIGQIESIVSELDANAARKETVSVFQLKNASPQEMANVLQALFQKNTTATTRSTSTQNDPLETRRNNQTQRMQSSGSTGTMGSRGTGGGGMGSSGGGAGGQ
jgi:general secretion pathway protein D